MHGVGSILLMFGGQGANWWKNFRRAMCPKELTFVLLDQRIVICFWMRLLYSLVLAGEVEMLGRHASPRA